MLFDVSYESRMITFHNLDKDKKILVRLRLIIKKLGYSLTFMSTHAFSI